MNTSRVSALRATVNRQTEAASKLLLSSKETLEKRGIIESVFCACRDVFMEVPTVLTSIIDERSTSTSCIAVAIKKIVGPTVEMFDTTSFLIVPNENKRDKNVSSQVTKDTLCRVLKSADYGLKVRRISYARDNGVRIEVFSPDIEKIKNMKLNPRLIIHGVPADIWLKRLRMSFWLRTMYDVSANDVKIVYIFTPKQDRRITSCILEDISAVRRILLGSGQIYLRYSACLFADHVRIIAKVNLLTDIAEAYEMKDCRNRDQPPKCLNCERHHVFHYDFAYSAMDAAKCSILGRRVKDKIANTSYE
ncbi:hypothetical protein ACFW04_007425 [Cataglyphis niger]